MTDRAVPMLVSLDLTRTWKFYRYFGFDLVSPAEDVLAEEDASHLTLQRGEVLLYFSRTSTDFTLDENLGHSHSCYIEVEDFQAWRDAFARTRMGWKMFYPRLGEVNEARLGSPGLLCRRSRRQPDLDRRARARPFSGDRLTRYAGRGLCAA